MIELEIHSVDSTDKQPPSTTEVEAQAPMDVDALFNELDKGFTEKLQEIKSELVDIKPDVALESVALSAEYLKEGNSKDGDVLTPDPILEFIEAKPPEVFSITPRFFPHWRSSFFLL